MTLFLILLNLAAGVLSAAMYTDSGDFISLYCCILSTGMFFVLYIKEFWN